VFQHQVNAEGMVERVHTSTTPPVSLISDNDLDALVASTLEIFPQFGRRMIRGHLKSQGYRIPRERMTHSYLRVHGAPAIFGDRQISRKRYSVDPELMAHLLENNVQEVPHAADDPFASASTPANLSEVLCEPPGCPFTPAQLQLLDTRLAASVDLFSRNMSVRRVAWQTALSFARNIYQGIDVT
jgi:hypothetical protein